MTITRGKFKMMAPCLSRRGYWIIGALVGSDKTVSYVKRVAYGAGRDDLRRAYGQLREEIHRDHRGIQEEFTVYRPRVGYN